MMRCPRVSWALRCISDAHHPTWAAPPLKWRRKWPEQTRNSDLFIPLRQLASKTFCNHANQNLLHYSTSLQKQINVGCFGIYSPEYTKSQAHVCGSHLLYRRILQGLCSPQQCQLWFLPHLTMAECVQASDRLKLETKSFQLFLIK